MMTTKHTEHPSMESLAADLLKARVGDTVVYATGDLGFSCDGKKNNDEIVGVRKMVWSAYETGEFALTQYRLKHLPFVRSNDGASYEYRATRIRTREEAAKLAKRKL